MQKILIISLDTPSTHTHTSTTHIYSKRMLIHGIHEDRRKESAKFVSIKYLICIVNTRSARSVLMVDRFICIETTLMCRTEGHRQSDTVVETPIVYAKPEMSSTAITLQTECGWNRRNQCCCGRLGSNHSYVAYCTRSSNG